MLKVSRLLKATSSPCRHCDGTGLENAYGPNMGSCSRCGGSGYIHDEFYPKQEAMPPSEEDLAFEARERESAKEWAKQKAEEHAYYLEMQDRYGLEP